MLINGVNQLKNDQTTFMDIRDLDVAESVLDLIGKTPLVRLPRIGDGVPCPVVAKLETTVLACGCGRPILIFVYNINTSSNIQ